MQIYSCARCSTALQRSRNVRPLSRSRRYNTQTKMVTTTRILIEFFMSGHVVTSYKFFTYKMVVYQSKLDMVCGSAGTILPRIWGHPETQLHEARRRVYGAAVKMRSDVQRLVAVLIVFDLCRFVENSSESHWRSFSSSFCATSCKRKSGS